MINTHVVAGLEGDGHNAPLVESCPRNGADKRDRRLGVVDNDTDRARILGGQTGDIRRNGTNGGARGRRDSSRIERERVRCVGTKRCRRARAVHEEGDRRDAFVVRCSCGHEQCLTGRNLGAGWRCNDRHRWRRGLRTNRDGPTCDRTDLPGDIRRTSGNRELGARIQARYRPQAEVLERCTGRSDQLPADEELQLLDGQLAIRRHHRLELRQFG